jgi:hypothetical protein
MSLALNPPPASATSASLKVTNVTASRYERPVIVTILILIGYSFVIQQGPWRDEYALYFAHSWNLAAGQPYSATAYLYNPAEPEIGPPAVPRLFPLLFAPVFRLAGFDLPLIKSECLLLLLAAQWAVYRYLRHFLPVGYRVAILIVMGLSRYCRNYLTNTPNSAAPFLCLFFLLLERPLVVSRRQWKKLSDLLGIGVLLYLYCARRAIGLILFPCLTAAEMLRTSGVPPRNLWLSVTLGALGVAVQSWRLPSRTPISTC